MKTLEAFLFDLEDTFVKTARVIELPMGRWCRENDMDLELAIEKGRGVVTSSSHEQAIRKLKARDLPVPGVIGTGNTVSKGEPDPEPYLQAVDQLAVSPADCLVFEDSDSGVISAAGDG